MEKFRATAMKPLLIGRGIRSHIPSRHNPMGSFWTTSILLHGKITFQFEFFFMLKITTFRPYMPALDRNKLIECDKCGERIVIKNFSRHNKSCMRGSLFCAKCPKFTAETKKELDYHTAKKHRKEGLTKNFTCTECMLTFHSFHALCKQAKSSW